MFRGVKIKLYPNESQKDYLANLFGCYRKVYNMTLAYKIEQYEKFGVNVSRLDAQYKFHNEWTKDQSMAYLRDHNTKVLKESMRTCFDAFDNFFKGRKRGVGFPKFKYKSDSHKSVNFPIEAISKKNDYNSNRITLTSELKNIKFRTSKENHEYLTRNKSKIRSASLSKQSNGDYYLSILIDGDQFKEYKKVPSNLVLGVDVGIKDFLVTSNGDKYENIKTIRNNEDKLKRLQQNLSRKQKGSKNWEEARIALAKFNNKIFNVKLNYLHLTTNKLLDENQVIALEDLNVSGMLQNHCMAKSMSEISSFKFKTILKYKAKNRGRLVVEVGRFYPSSKLCSKCQYKNVNLTLKDREWTCPVCKSVHDRDFNASYNIKGEGINIIMKDVIMLSIVVDMFRNNKNLTVDSAILLEYLNTPRRGFMPITKTSKVVFGVGNV